LKKRSFSSVEESSSSLTEAAESFSSQSSHKDKRHQYAKKVNKLDPIMFTTLKKNVYKFYRPNGTYVAFNVDTLVDYMLTTGDFSDPETRIPFSDDNLHDIDQAVFSEISTFIC